MYDGENKGKDIQKEGIIMFRRFCAGIVTLYCVMLQAGWAEETLAQLTRRQKIAQSFCISLIADSGASKDGALEQLMKKSPYNFDPTYVESLVRNEGVGGIIYLYKSSVCQQAQRTNELQAQSNVPLMVMLDAEWGLAMRTNDGMQFPKAMTLAATNDDELITQVGYEIGRQCRAIGVHMVCAPVADVNNNPKNPVIGMRSFGDDPVNVAERAQAFVNGLTKAGIIACAKHFPGHGDTTIDSHVSLPMIAKSRQQLNKTELTPFRHLISGGIKAIMTAHLSVPVLDDKKPTSLSSRVVTDLLRKELGFDGLVVTDGLGMGAVHEGRVAGQVELEAFLAGHDVLLCPVDVSRAIDLIEQALNDGRMSENELDRRTLKILKIKEHLKLHEQRLMSLDGLAERLNTTKAGELKRQAFRTAVTQLNNDDASLPDLTQTAMLVVGADTDTPLVKMLRQHGLDTVLNIAADSIDDVCESIEQQLVKYKSVLVALYGAHRLSGRITLSSSVQKLIDHITERGGQILVFGSPYTIAHCPTVRAIIGYEDDEESQRAVAEVITGQFTPIGQLPVILTALQ